MTYALLFLAISVSLAVLGVTSLGVVAEVTYLYLACSFALVAILYISRSGLDRFKAPDGHLTALCWFAFFPYLAFARLSFFLKSLVTREPSFDLVTSNLYLGRWHRTREASVLDDLDVRAILDLTWEFGASERLVERRHYLNLPVLDGAAPTPDQLRIGVAWLARRVVEGPVAVHCALGHGRSATVVVAYLLSVGLAATADDAVETVTRQRPGASLNREQRSAAVAFANSAIQAAQPN